MESWGYSEMKINNKYKKNSDLKNIEVCSIMDIVERMDPLDSIFEENYQIEDNSESDEGDTAVDLSDDLEKMEIPDKLGISEEQARFNLANAGTEVEEEADRITIAGNLDLINPETDAILDRIVDKLNMPYKPAEFQRVAVNALGEMRNVILVSPTGSGKMNIPLWATLVLREKLQNYKGLSIITQPLSSIMNEKKKNNICDAAVLSMAGELTTSLDNDESANLSCDLHDLLNGKYPCLFGHPESFDSKLGQHILRELQRLDRILLVSIDEFHQGGQGHWNSFRPNMMKGSTGLRLYGVKNCPSLAMTATSTKSEIDEVVAALGLRMRPVVLTSTPVQSHIKFSVVRRPSNNFGLDGTTTEKGVENPGLMDLLQRVFLKQYLDDLNNKREPKRCIIFCRGNGVLGAIYSRLMELTNYRYRDCRDSPFIMNHSSLLPPTEKVLAERSSEISLYLSSNKMLLGIDLAKVDVIIFLRPYNQIAALVQGGGRGGRRMEDGKRRRVQVYQFYNSQDFTSQNKLMSAEMKMICQSPDCTRLLLKDYFVGNSEEQKEEVVVDSNHCCHNCDQKVS